MSGERPVNGNGNSNGHGRGIMAYWQVITAAGLLAVQWGVQSNRIDTIGDRVKERETWVNQRFLQFESDLRIAQARVADTDRLVALNSDRMASEVQRSTQADVQMDAMAKGLVTAAQQMATLQERIATVTQLDNPRLREIEQMLATLKGIVDEHGRSLVAIRELLIADARANRPLVQPGRSQ